MQVREHRVEVEITFSFNLTGVADDSSEVVDVFTANSRRKSLEKHQVNTKNLRILQSLPKPAPLSPRRQSNLPIKSSNQPSISNRFLTLTNSITASKIPRAKLVRCHELLEILRRFSFAQTVFDRRKLRNL
jgi:hypothetical protein